MKNGKVILIIMDGWGIAENPEVSAIDKAKTPFYDQNRKNFPHNRLFASEEAVGLPHGQMGNSEVGHMNIGAGRIVFQELARITNAMKTGEFARNQVWKNLLSYCAENKKPLHLLGLLSDGGVHSHIEHLEDILKTLAGEEFSQPVFIHVFTDGRDCDPHSGKGFITRLEKTITETGKGKIASLIGRYFSMDRNNQWDRIKKAYDLLVSGKGKTFSSALSAIESWYDEDITDEFLKPSVIVENGKAVGTINEGDGVLFYNFRTDRGRQLTTALTQKDMHEFNMHAMNLCYETMTQYDASFNNVDVVFEKDSVKNGLGEFLSANGKKQIRIAETEKYPHVTFFFNGGKEEPFPGEMRILCPSPKVPTYDMQPEMSAADIRDKIIPELEKREVDFVCLNFANPDMVGHTGVFEAAVKACETVDACTQAVSEAALKNGYHVLITADHGNADKMINEDGTPNTAHTTAPVPIIYLDPNKGNWKLKEGKLGDLAPTILHLMGLEPPSEMTGENLIEIIS